MLFCMYKQWPRRSAVPEKVHILYVYLIFSKGELNFFTFVWYAWFM